MPFNPLYVLITAVLIRFLAYKDIGIPEAIVYSMLSLSLVSYFLFDAYFKFKIKSEKVEPLDTKEIKEELSDLKTKLNSVMLRMGFKQ